MSTALTIGWARKRLDAISESIEYGLTASASQSPSGPRFLRITDIQNDSVDWSTVPFCDAPNVDTARYTLRYGDIVFARTGATTGKSFLIRECPDSAVFASYLIRVRPNREVEPRFLSHFFRTTDYWGQIEKSTQGAGQPGVNASKLKDLTVPLPPLEEQTRIADILDKADSIRRKHEYGLAQIRDLPHALFLSLFGAPHAHQDRWPMIPFTEVCESRLGKMLDAKQQTGQCARPYLRNLNVQWGRLDLNNVFQMDFNESDRREFRLEPGDVLICEGGAGVGQTAIWRGELPECYFQKSLHRVRPFAGKAVSEYIAHLIWMLMRSGSLIGSISSATIPHLTGVRLKALKIPVPPIELQRDFARQLEAQQTLLCKTAKAESESVLLFSSLISRAFRGDL